MYNLTISHFSQYGNIKLSELTVANLQSIYSMIFVGIATCLIAYKLSYFVARKIYNMIASKRELHIFEITKGDNDSIQLINDSKKKGVKNILLNILFQLAISIVSGLVMNLFS